MEKTSKIPKRGEIWLVKFKKAKETPKTFRPCLAISSDIQINKGLRLVDKQCLGVANKEIMEKAKQA